MPLTRRYNTQPVQERLLHEAVEAERKGDHDLANKKLDMATRAEYYVTISKVHAGTKHYKFDLYPLDTSFCEQWLLSEDIDWSDTPDLEHMKYHIFGPKRSLRAEKKRGIARYRAVKKFKENKKNGKSENED